MDIIDAELAGPLRFLRYSEVYAISRPVTSLFISYYTYMYGINTEQEGL